MESIDTMLEYTFMGNPLEVWLQGAAIFAIFLVMRYKLIQALLAVFKRLSAKTQTQLDDKLVQVIDKPLRMGVVIVGLYFALSVFKLSTDMNATMGHMVRSLIIVMAVWIVYRALAIFSDSLQSISRRFHSELGESLAKLLLSIFKAFVIIIGLVSIFQEWGFNVSGFLASLGLVGMAFALAAKDTASNLFGSMVIFTDRPFKIGDWVKTPDVEGTIEEIGIRSTKVRTFAQALVSVPNGVLANSAILNWSKMRKRRIKMTIGLTYSTSAAQMQAILGETRELLQSDEEVHPDTIFVHFTEFAESSLGIFFYFFTKTTNWGEYMQVRERLNLEIMKIVERNGASFAFPTQSLYIENLGEEYVERAVGTDWYDGRAPEMS